MIKIFILDLVYVYYSSVKFIDPATNAVHEYGNLEPPPPRARLHCPRVVPEYMRTPQEHDDIKTGQIRVHDCIPCQLWNMLESNDIQQWEESQSVLEPPPVTSTPLPSTWTNDDGGDENDHDDDDVDSETMYAMIDKVRRACKAAERKHSKVAATDVEVNLAAIKLAEGVCTSPVMDRKVKIKKRR